MSDENNIVETVLNNLPSVSQHIDEDGVPYAYVPRGFYVQNLEEFLERPRRIRQNINFDDVSGFISYVKEYGDGKSKLFAHLNGVTAIFDYHTREFADRGTHRAFFKTQHTPEWLEWSSSIGKRFNQSAFANFLESVLPTIYAPAAADVLQVVRSIRASITNKYVSVIDDDGLSANLEFKRDVEVRGTGKQVELPKQLKVLLKPYLGADFVTELPIRLRYELEDEGSRVVFAYEILQFDRIRQEAFERLATLITEETNIQTFLGGQPRD